MIVWPLSMQLKLSFEGYGSVLSILFRQYWRHHYLVLAKTICANLKPHSSDRSQTVDKHDAILGACRPGKGQSNLLSTQLDTHHAPGR